MQAKSARRPGWEATLSESPPGERVHRPHDPDSSARESAVHTGPPRPVGVGWNGMRAGVVAALAAMLFALAPADARATSCAPTLTWRGTLYGGGWGTRGVEFGRPIGTGYVPDCPNPGEKAGPPSPVTLLRVTGVRPAIAVGTRHDRDLYLAEGFFVESRRHPLHRNVFGRRSPNETRGWSCGPAFRRTGRVTSVPPLNLRVAYGRTGRERHFFVDAQTRFDDRLTRLGVPYLSAGTRVSLTAKRCTASGGRWKLVARSFAPAGGSVLAG